MINVMAELCLPLLNKILCGERFEMTGLLIVALGVAMLLVLLVWCKLDAFISLILVSISVGLMAVSYTHIRAHET